MVEHYAQLDCLDTMTNRTLELARQTFDGKEHVRHF
jgi:hypothetical protein